ncbi:MULTISPECIES: hypothetical protein [Serratia]|uniref:hypothetical protein n=1 Tax=Serratia TaxID=613 RepID=UPI000E2AC034|nr:hypothetical protein [Serratia fonticola]RDL21156.1 hypothetical protein DFO62_11025 [Serratia fonticola]
MRRQIITFAGKKHGDFEQTADLAPNKSSLYNQLNSDLAVYRWQNALYRLSVIDLAQVIPTFTYLG